MFGISLSEILVIAMIALVVVGPQKLPGMLRSLGQGIRKLRRLTSEVRAQTGIDEILREEGIDGVHELRSLLRGEIAAARRRPTQPREDPYLDAIEFDQGREYPVEGADAYGAMPDDLIEDEQETDASQTSESDSNASGSDAAAGDATETIAARTDQPGTERARDSAEPTASGADMPSGNGAKTGDGDPPVASEAGELRTQKSVASVEASPPKTS